MAASGPPGECGDTPPNGVSPARFLREPPEALPDGPPAPARLLRCSGSSGGSGCPEPGDRLPLLPARGLAPDSGAAALRRPASGPRTSAGLWLRPRGFVASASGPVGPRRAPTSCRLFPVRGSVPGSGPADLRRPAPGHRCIRGPGRADSWRLLAGLQLRAGSRSRAAHSRPRTRAGPWLWPRGLVASASRPANPRPARSCGPMPPTPGPGPRAESRTRGWASGPNLEAGAGPPGRTSNPGPGLRPSLEPGAGPPGRTSNPGPGLRAEPPRPPPGPRPDLDLPTGYFLPSAGCWSVAKKREMSVRHEPVGASVSGGSPMSQSSR